MNKKISTSVEYAAPKLWRIFAAMVYDSLLLAAISIAYGALVVGAYVIVVGKPEVGHRIEWAPLAKLVISIGWIAIIALFFIFFWHRFGQTLGMKTWRLQLIDSHTLQVPNYRQCAKRIFWAAVSVLCFGGGYWYSLLNVQGRTLHDLCSETQLIVLKKK